MSKDSRKSAYWEPDGKWLTKHKGSIKAVQALWTGSANEGQQVAAMHFILDVLCDRMGTQYYPDQRETDFALGKKFVGDLIAGAIKAKLGQIKEPINDRVSPRQLDRKRRP